VFYHLSLDGRGQGEGENIGIKINPLNLILSHNGERKPIFARREKERIVRTLLEKKRMDWVSGTRESNIYRPI
jgi:hypothetical protein